MHFDTVLRTVLIALLLCGVAAFGFGGCAHGKKDKPDGKSCTLSFHSFDGGGPSYRVAVGDGSVLSYTSEKRYNQKNHEELDGAGYDMIFTFRGLKSGSTTVTVTGESPIMGTEITVYAAAVDENLTVTLTKQEETTAADDAIQPVPQLVLHTEAVTVYPSAEDTKAARMLIEQLSETPVTVTLHSFDGQFRGDLPKSLPYDRILHDAAPGELLLYGNSELVLCTEEQLGPFTPLAKLDETALARLLPALEADPTISLWVEWSE